LKAIDVSEEYVAFIFKVEKYPVQETGMKQEVSNDFDPEGGDNMLLRNVCRLHI
jgi:hypothetical protein